MGIIHNELLIREANSSWERERSPDYKFVFDYLRYLDMWYIWNLQNGFLFDGLSRVSQHICRIRGKLIWQFSQLCCMGTLSPNELHLCRFVLQLQHLRRLSLPHHYLWRSFDSKVFFVLSCCFNINIHLRERERERERDVVSLLSTKI